ncbi:MAG: helix-turn-helix domain-containing protein [Sphingomonadales bacterium]|nr:helix-turn-helix domain-containing protein [Sphingomonadales bacterium]
MVPETNLLSVEQAAAHIGVSPWTLRKWRTKGKGPCFVRLGCALGAVRYRRQDLDAYLEASVVDPSA